MCRHDSIAALDLKNTLFFCNVLIHIALILFDVLEEILDVHLQQMAMNYVTDFIYLFFFSPCLHFRPVGMPKMEKVYLHNPSSEETIILISISATTAHFHASFFQNRVSFRPSTSRSLLWLTDLALCVTWTLAIARQLVQL